MSFPYGLCKHDSRGWHPSTATVKGAELDYTGSDVHRETLQFSQPDRLRMGLTQ